MFHINVALFIGKVRPDMRKKALVDAIRITCRNIFWRAFGIFRTLHNNRRNDHVILRAITRSSGVIVPVQGRIDVYLTAQLQREPAKWQGIQKSLEICQYHFARQFHIPIRILARKSHK